MSALGDAVREVGVHGVDLTAVPLEFLAREVMQHRLCLGAFEDLVNIDAGYFEKLIRDVGTDSGDANGASQRTG